MAEIVVKSLSTLMPLRVGFEHQSESIYYLDFAEKQLYYQSGVPASKEYTDAVLKAVIEGISEPEDMSAEIAAEMQEAQEQGLEEEAKFRAELEEEMNAQPVEDGEEKEEKDE